MKKLLVYLTVLVGMASFAQTGPKIEFKEETINYGEVEKGKDDGIRVFEFTNTGDQPLIIKNAKSSCGCTVPEWPKEPIAPGGKNGFDWSVGRRGRARDQQSDRLRQLQHGRSAKLRPEDAEPALRVREA